MADNLGSKLRVLSETVMQREMDEWISKRWPTWERLMEAAAKAGSFGVRLEDDHYLCHIHAEYLRDWLWKHGLRVVFGNLPSRIYVSWSLGGHNDAR